MIALLLFPKTVGSPLPNSVSVATIIRDAEVYPLLLSFFLSCSPEQLRNRRAWCSEEDEVLALSRLSMVMKALTPRHFDVVVCLAKKLKSSPELGGEKEYNAGTGPGR